ncbi:MAG: glycosyltransferase family 4 protein [Chloroflexi bacterium]|nr:glycosyltransferase family 4 protein [Chloroflexota bacterium]
MANSPRLTYITTAAFPAPKASSVQVMQMCAAFAEVGALVKLVARQAATQINADVFAHYGLPPIFSFETRPLPRWPRPTDLLQAQAVFAEQGSDWICYSRIRDLTAPVLALARGAKAAVEVHGRPATLRERVMLKWIGRHPRGRLFTISEPLQDIYRRDYGLVTHVAPDAVDMSRFNPSLTTAQAREQLGLESGLWVVYVGGLYEGRGLESLFTAVSGLPVNLLIAGGRSPEEVAVWRERAESLGATRIRFEGYQPPARVPLYLFAADVLAMPYGKRVMTPSGEDIAEWISPMKLFEYLAARRPIVSSDLPVLRTVLAHEKNALLVGADDAVGLRAAIERVLRDPALANRLAAEAQQTARRYTWAERAKRILEMIGRDDTNRSS